VRAFAQTHAGTHQTQSFFKRENKEREKKTHAGTHQTPLEWWPVAYENKRINTHTPTETKRINTYVRILNLTSRVWRQVRKKTHSLKKNIL